MIKIPIQFSLQHKEMSKKGFKCSASCHSLLGTEGAHFPIVTIQISANQSLLHFYYDYF